MVNHRLIAASCRCFITKAIHLVTHRKSCGFLLKSSTEQKEEEEEGERGKKKLSGMSKHHQVVLCCCCCCCVSTKKKKEEEDWVAPFRVGVLFNILDTRPCNCLLCIYIQQHHTCLYTAPTVFVCALEHTDQLDWLSNLNSVCFC